MTGSKVEPWRRDPNPYKPGNVEALVHGAESPRVIEGRAAQVHQQLTTVAPWLVEEHYAPALARYLRACAREELLHQHIERVTADGDVARVPVRLWEGVTAAARLAAKLGSDLGLDPLGHARLKAMTGTAALTEASLAEVLAAGRATRAATEASVRPVQPPDAIGRTIDPGEPL